MNFYSRLKDVFTGSLVRYEIKWRDNRIKSLEDFNDRNFKTYKENLDRLKLTVRSQSKDYTEQIDSYRKEYRKACIKAGLLILTHPDSYKTNLTYSDLKVIWMKTDMIKYEFPIMAVSDDKFVLNTSSMETAFIILNALDDLHFRCSIFEELLKASYELDNGWTVNNETKRQIKDGVILI